MITPFNAPNTLFKYCRLDQYFYDMIKNKQLWFSSPPDFNDPFDCNVSWEVEYSKKDIENFVRNILGSDVSNRKIKDKIKEFKSKPSLVQKTIDDLKKHIHTMGVCCFSGDRKNVLMWAHYADSHKGVCIAFSTPVLFNTFVAHLFPVEYVRDFPKVNLMKAHDEAVTKILMTKSEHWKYEKEYRFTTQRRGLFPFPHKAIDHIIFGLRTPENEVIEAITFMKANGYTDQIFYKAQMDNKSYQLNYVPCNII